MTRALLRADQMRDADVLTEAEHLSLVHQNLTTSGTLNFQDGTISGTGNIYAGNFYGDGSNLSGISSEPESLYYSGSPKATADANGISTQRISNGNNYITLDNSTNRVNIYSNSNKMVEVDNIVTILHADGSKCIETASSYIDFYGASAARRFQLHPHDSLTQFVNLSNSSEMVFRSKNSSAAQVDMLRLDPDAGATVPEDSFIYFGSPTASGSWRMGISGENFIHQKYNGSTWETRQTIIGSESESFLEL